jgi:hypothetical protein
VLLDAVIGYEVNVHGARHLLGAVIPAPFRTAATAPAQQPGRSTQKIVVGPDESGQRAG